MSYTVILRRAQRKQLNAFPVAIRSRIESALLALEDDPRPANCKKMVGEIATWRLKVGSYRVVYEIQDEELLIFVIRTAHRRDVYRKK